ncbi:MAG: IS6 family transposase [Pseudomonadota bacterium]
MLGFEVGHARKSPFKHHRFPRDIILCAVRWYSRFPLSYRDVVNLLAERGIAVDQSTFYRWVQKFGPELTKHAERHLRRASVDWHLEKTYIRVGGKWRYLWRAIDANGQMVDFRLTKRRDAKAARAFLSNAIERVRLHRTVKICTDKAHTYRRVISEINHRYDPYFDSIRHIDRKWRNNLVESDHAAVKRLLGYRQSFRSLRTAKPSNAVTSITNHRASKAKSSSSVAFSRTLHTSAHLTLAYATAAN